MEKLIELLNEYEIWKGKNGLDIRQQYSEHNFKYNKWLYNIVISKKYKFIKRLVENDKIDLEAQAMQYAKSDLSKFFAEWKDKNGMSDDYAMLLMLLAIQDEPINFLISILK